MTFDDIMNREVDTAYIKVAEKFDNDGITGNEGYMSKVMIVGMGTPDAIRFRWRCVHRKNHLQLHLIGMHNSNLGWHSKRRGVPLSATKV
ncbi:MAG: hypothetical protein CM15mP71_2510 [Candidatus Poseidoniales archaeon]|nr:MAG: hypothetical protein CM15mP71_2510 [Candidatus Poseidoniales archaeon]